MKKKLLRLGTLCLLLMIAVVSKAGENDLTWDYSEKAPADNPDNGLYYKDKVNDAAGTNLGLKGIKLNSSGWAAFTKAAVAGKLTLSISNRKNSSAYAVNVYKCSNVGATASKGELIGEVSVEEGPGSGSLDIPADVTGIFIERKTSSEGVLSKIVFKEDIARTFVDFEIPYATLTADGYTGTDLPTGVSFSGSFHDKQHGYSNATMVVPVDGTVKFTISGCQYGGSFPVKNTEGKTLATLDQKAAGCYDAGGTVSYIYVGDATTLTFGPIQYLSYFKAEATEVSEATITYKDQNGKELGKKTVYEGDPIGEIPYTEADLTIPDGEKFRGWYYTNNMKVKATDVVTGNVSVNAKVTPIESVSVGTIQTYDLASATFYPEDHETIDIANGTYYNNHGWNIAAGGTITVDVAGNAQVVLTLCEYGNGTTITATDANNNVVMSDIPAKAEKGKDGATTTINYKGEATKLTLTFAAQSYLHKIVVYNVKDFLEKDKTSGFYIVPAGDAASLIMALNNAATEEGAKIFLPNGTYDLGETVQTGISGKKISIIGESMEKTIVKNAPPVSAEGLKTASLFHNTSTDLYLQDLTLQNDLDYYGAGSAGRANAFHDDGNHTIAKNVKLMSYQDTYLSTTDKQFYWEDSELHGAVDFLCGGSDVFFERCKLVTESRKKGEKNGEATITAHQPRTGEKFGYVFNNCTIDNQAATFNFGRAWGGASGATARPMVTYLNTTLLQPTEIIATRFIIKGMNDQSGVFHEYNSVDANGSVVSPNSNSQTFTDKNGQDAQTYETILTKEEAANYSIEKVLGSWAATAQATTKQVEAPTDAKLENGTITWTAVEGAASYAITADGELLAIVDGTTTSYTITETPAASRRADGNITYTIRAANARGGFGEARTVTDATAIEKVKADEKIDWNNQVVYDLQGRRVKNASKGVFIINGHKVIIK